MLFATFPKSVEAKLKSEAKRIYGNHLKEHNQQKLKELDHQMNASLLNITNRLTQSELSSLINLYLNPAAVQMLKNNGATDADINQMRKLTTTELSKNINMQQSIITFLSYHLSKMGL